jgi:hypothetical protein
LVVVRGASVLAREGGVSVGEVADKALLKTLVAVSREREKERARLGGQQYQQQQQQYQHQGQVQPPLQRYSGNGTKEGGRKGGREEGKKGELHAHFRSFLQFALIHPASFFPSNTFILRLWLHHPCDSLHILPISHSPFLPPSLPPSLLS